MRMMATPEGRVKAALSRRVQAEFGSHLFSFMPVQNGMGAPGLDYFWCMSGYFVAVETKVPGKDLTPRQKVTAAVIQKAGGHVYEVRTNEDITRLIATMHWLPSFDNFNPYSMLEEKDYSKYHPDNNGDHNGDT